MSYDPFVRGPHPVGVRSFELHDATRARSLDAEIWYPAGERYGTADLEGDSQDRYELIAGLRKVTQAALRDADPANLSGLPLVVFSHGFGGHRRQSTFLCTHLASHGYVVAAVDHRGNTIADVAAKMSRKRTVQPSNKGQESDDRRSRAANGFRQIMEHRPADFSFLISELLAGSAAGLSSMIDAGRIGAAGHSFGGWTILTATASDPRIRALLALAPAGGRTQMPVNPLRENVRLDWGRDVPTLYLAANHDTVLPLDGIDELFDRTQASKRMAVLSPADHMHFCDRAEEIHELFRMTPQPWPFSTVAGAVLPISELCPADHAYQWVRALGLAHFDSVFRPGRGAEEFLSGDLAALFADRGINVSLRD